MQLCVQMFLPLILAPSEAIPETPVAFVIKDAFAGLGLWLLQGL